MFALGRRGEIVREVDVRKVDAVALGRERPAKRERGRRPIVVGRAPFPSRGRRPVGVGVVVVVVGRAPLPLDHRRARDAPPALPVVARDGLEVVKAARVRAALEVLDLEDARPPLHAVRAEVEPLRVRRPIGPLREGVGADREPERHRAARTERAPLAHDVAGVERRANARQAADGRVQVRVRVGRSGRERARRRHAGCEGTTLPPAAPHANHIGGRPPQCRELELRDDCEPAVQLRSRSERRDSKPQQTHGRGQVK